VNCSVAGTAPYRRRPRRGRPGRPPPRSAL